MLSSVIKAIQERDTKELARAISLVENEADGFEKLLQALPKLIFPNIFTPSFLIFKIIVDDNRNIFL